MVEDLVDPRRGEPSFLLAERAMLESWLEFHRTTLELKAEGLTDSQRKTRPVPTSKLSLHGLVRQWPRWNAIGFAGSSPLRTLDSFGLTLREDSELVPLEDADWEADLAAWKVRMPNQS